MDSVLSRCILPRRNEAEKPTHLHRGAGIMANDSNANVPSQEVSASSSEATTGVKPARSWVLPVITAVVLASAFCLYYFVYVAARRDYLTNRNFRSLAVLGDQVQAMVSVHGSVLEIAADLAENTGNPTHRKKKEMEQFVVVRPEDVEKPKAEKDQAALNDYLKYLAPGFELEDADTKTKARPQPGPRLKVQRRNGHWEMVLRAHKHNDSKKAYVGSLELSGVLRPLVASLPFDDILLVSGNGTIVYQRDKVGPQFTTLTRLLQAQAGEADNKSAGSAAETKSAGSAESTKPTDNPADAHSGLPPGHDYQEADERAAVSQNADPTWRARSTHLTDVVLAGTHYKLFLQPVLVDVFNDEPKQEEPSQEWVICGLRSAKALEWEALSISSTFMMGLTALFLAILMSAPILKVLFINRREHLRLREVGFLGIFLVLLTSVFTLSGLNAVGFPLNDDTEEQLHQLGNKLSKNIHDELRDMRGQLQDWCKHNNNNNNKNDLREDLGNAESQEVIRRPKPKLDGSSIPGVDKPPEPPPATIYPYLNNAFWTDDDGIQIVKWSPRGYVTPMIDLSHSPLNTGDRSTYLDGEGPAFHFDSILPLSKVEYLAGLTMSTVDCNPALPDSGLSEDVTGGSAFITAQPLSLIDPILPFGYGFALFDDTGLVLFHADKTKNLHENFLQETDWNKQLYAAAFGHSTGSSLEIKYLGKDYQARVIPVTGASQAPWSLIVYRDLTFMRTLNLQSMTMTSMLFLLMLVLPTIIIAIWCAIRRPQFAPEWLWPNRPRMSTYVYLIIVYTLLIILFVFLGFTGSSEQNVIVCFAIPYSALLLTALPLLDRPRRYLDVWWKRSFQRRAKVDQISGRPEVGPYAWRKCYFLSLVLLLLLVGVLTPMALFRASLNVERRLGIKQAQLHLASALDRRLISTIQRCKDAPGVDQLGAEACDKFVASAAWPEKECKRTASSEDGLDADKISPWCWIVLDPLFPADGKLPVSPHSSDQPGKELYSDRFQNLIYRLHLDYNQTAAEMLGVVPDRVTRGADSVFPDWSWENKGSTLILHWHGIHLVPAKSKAAKNGSPSDPSPAPEGNEPENDLLITSTIPASSGSFAGLAVAAVAIVAIGLIVWTLARRIFLFHVDPLKLTGALRLAESVRNGRSVVILVPPVAPDWHLAPPPYRVDLMERAATGPKWAEDLPVNTVIEIPHFEQGWDHPEVKNQKFDLLKQLLEIKNIQVAVIMVVPASPEDYGRVFHPLGLELIDLREAPFYWLEQYKGTAQKLIWKECGPMPALWPIGAQLAKDIKTESVHSPETIASEILERADGYYRLVWKECSDDQKFVLAQLAEDGLLNPTNGRAIRQLVREGLITTDPQFRLMNESFRRFLRSATSAGLKQQWLRESRSSGWGKMHGVFFTTMILLGAFLLTTQNALWQSSAAYVTTALGALGTLAKLFNTYRGGGTTEKAG